MNKITCAICSMPVPETEISQYNQFIGLPSPCCEICFEVSDHTDTSIESVAQKSLLRRSKMLTDDSFKQ